MVHIILSEFFMERTDFQESGCHLFLSLSLAQLDLSCQQWVFFIIIMMLYWVQVHLEWTRSNQPGVPLGGQKHVVKMFSFNSNKQEAPESTKSQQDIWLLIILEFSLMALSFINILGIWLSPFYASITESYTLDYFFKKEFISQLWGQEVQDCSTSFQQESSCTP